MLSGESRKSRNVSKTLQAPNALKEHYLCASLAASENSIFCLRFQTENTLNAEGCAWCVRALSLTGLFNVSTMLESNFSERVSHLHLVMSFYCISPTSTPFGNAWINASPIDFSTRDCIIVYQIQKLGFITQSLCLIRVYRVQKVMILKPIHYFKCE